MNRIRRIPVFSGRGRQRGIALFVSLVLLLILTIIGVSAVQTTTLETRMARNEHDRLLAFQAAESVLRDAEAFLETLTNTAGFVPGCANGLCDMVNNFDEPIWEDPNFNWAGARSPEIAMDADLVAAQPTYVIEYVASVIREENAYQLNDPYAGGVADRIEIFRITARGVGGSQAAQVMLQSTYGRILN